MRIATWNVNSVRARTDRVTEVLQRWDVDVLALQETKCKTDQFPAEPFTQLGYECTAWGINQWNGVAAISRIGLGRVQQGFPGQPEFRDTLEPRALGVTCGSASTEIDVWSLYVPHGRALTDAHYTYKLEFLARLADNARAWLEQGREFVLVGDWNVAPLDSDVWDIDVFAGCTHVSAPERQAFAAFADLGLTEVTRGRADNYTYWDYKQLRFPRNEGMRIDFVYASPGVAARVQDVVIDREERKGKGASDHVPVIVTLEG